MWDGNYYALEVIARLRLEDKGGMVRVGPVHYNTLDEIQKFGKCWQILAASHSIYNPERLFAGYPILG